MATIPFNDKIDLQNIISSLNDINNSVQENNDDTNDKALLKKLQEISNALNPKDRNKQILQEENDRKKLMSTLSQLDKTLQKIITVNSVNSITKSSSSSSDNTSLISALQSLTQTIKMNVSTLSVDKGSNTSATNIQEIFGKLIEQSDNRMTTFMDKMFNNMSNNISNNNTSNGRIDKFQKNYNQNSDSRINNIIQKISNNSEKDNKAEKLTENVKIANIERRVDTISKNASNAEKYRNDPDNPQNKKGFLSAMKAAWEKGYTFAPKTDWIITAIKTVFGISFFWKILQKPIQQILDKLGPVGTAINWVMNNFTEYLPQIVGGFLALGGIIKAFSVAVGVFNTIVTAKNWIKNIASAVGTGLEKIGLVKKADAVTNAAGNLSDMAGNLGGSGNNAGKAAGKTGGKVSNFFKKLGGGFKSFGSKALNLVKGLGGRLGTIFKGLFNFKNLFSLFKSIGPSVLKGLVGMGPLLVAQIGAEVMDYIGDRDTKKTEEKMKKMNEGATKIQDLKGAKDKNGESLFESKHAMVYYESAGDKFINATGLNRFWGDGQKRVQSMHEKETLINKKTGVAIATRDENGNITYNDDKIKNAAERMMASRKKQEELEAKIAQIEKDNNEKYNDNSPISSSYRRANKDRISMAKGLIENLKKKDEAEDKLEAMRTGKKVKGIDGKEYYQSSLGNRYEVKANDSEESLKNEIAKLTEAITGQTKATEDNTEKTDDNSKETKDNSDAMKKDDEFSFSSYMDKLKGIMNGISSGFSESFGSIFGGGSSGGGFSGGGVAGASFGRSSGKFQAHGVNLLNTDQVAQQLSGDLNSAYNTAMVNIATNEQEQKLGYKLGAAQIKGNENMAMGLADCSQTVSHNLDVTMKAINKASGVAAFSQDTINKVRQGWANGGSGGILKAVSNEGKNLKSSNLLDYIDNAKAGDVIGLDTGNHGWDKDHYKGIDHVMQVVEKDGKRYISENNGATGQRLIPIEDYKKEIAKSKKLQNATAHVANVMDLADNKNIAINNANPKTNADFALNNTPTTVPTNVEPNNQVSKDVQVAKSEMLKTNDQRETQVSMPNVSPMSNQNITVNNSSGGGGSSNPQIRTIDPYLANASSSFGPNMC